MSAPTTRHERRSSAEGLFACAKRLGALVRHDAPLGERTTYRVGGRAALFVEITKQAELEAVTEAVVDSGVELLVLGCGSNLLVADEGFAGLCVTLGASFEAIAIDEDSGIVRAGAATRYPVLARRCAAASVAGLSWAVGIPGSVGGAVAMNAGGHGAETAARLVAAQVVDLERATTRVAPCGELELGYRASSLRPSELVTWAEFACEPGSSEEALREELAGIVSWRREHQPGGRNAGSVFTNPKGDAAGRLVEEAGLKGLRVGTAAVSTKHGNFIQADEGGSANDVYRLVGEVRRLVAQRLGVTLSTELKMIGFP